MRISILGCGGSRGKGSRTTAFFIDEKLLLDAGTATEVLNVERCTEIDNILITHAHIDHVCDLPFLIETVFDFRKEPVLLYGINDVIEDISSHIFNQRIWPDFSQIPSKEEAKLSYKVIEPLKDLEINSYRILPIPVNHTVPTVGYLIDDGKTAFAFTGDTCVTDLFWKKVRDEERLRALIVEVSFPSNLEEMARVTGHLTPALLVEEIKKLNRVNIEIFVTHIKPFCRREVGAELKNLSKKLPIKVLEDGMEIVLL